jgi:NTP pyrophosphatase (non-canonical NTP hydrolase)
MDWRNPKSAETMIARLTQEIGEIDAAIYGSEERDRVLVAGMLERKRDDIVRAAVLQLHTSIEDLLTSLVVYCALDITDEKLKRRLRSEKAKAYRKMLYGRGSPGFDMKLNFAVGLGLITPALQNRLMELNTMRNRCSHNWILKAVVRRGRRPKQQKPPLLLFRGRDLHKAAVLKDFIGEFGAIYVRLYARWASITVAVSF